MKEMIIRPEGTRCTSRNLEKAFEDYQKEKKQFAKLQKIQERNINNNLNLLKTNVKKFAKSHSDTFNDWAFIHLGDFEFYEQKLLEKYQKQQSDLFNSYLKCKYDFYFSLVEKNDWKVEYPDKALQQDIVEFKKYMMKKRKNNLKEQRRVLIGKVIAFFLELRHCIYEIKLNKLKKIK